MATKSTTFSIAGVADSSLWAHMAYQLKTWLVAQCGWTVVGSYDGTSQNYGGTDLITSATVFNAGAARGFILRSPDLKVELLCTRNITSSTGVSFWFNPCNADPTKYYSGTWNATTLPTATWSIALFNGTYSWGSATERFHISAESAAPYGFFCEAHDSLSPGSVRGSIALIPLDLLPTGATNCPYVCVAGFNGTPWTSVTSNGLGAESATNQQAGHQVVQSHVSPGVPVACSFWADLTAATSGVVCTPKGLGLDNSQDQSVPIKVGKSGGLWYGLSTYMRWQGSNRSSLDTLGSGSSQRLVFGDVSFPWDSTVTPVA